MTEKNQGTLISIRTPITNPDRSTRNYGILYGTGDPVIPAAAGTVLSNLALSALTATVQFVYAVTINTTDYTAGQVAPSFISNASLSNLPLTLDTDQSTPVITLPEGLWGLPNQSVEYLVTVTEKIVVGGVTKENAIAWERVKVIGPPV